ncbi:hypothetical protein Tco_1384232 [Tanacetum coccineum]
MDVAFDFMGKDNDGLGYGLDRSTNLWVHGHDILRDIFGHNSLHEVLDSNSIANNRFELLYQRGSTIQHVAFDFVGKDNDGLSYGLDRSTNLWVHGRDILRYIFGHNSLHEQTPSHPLHGICTVQSLGKGDTVGELALMGFGFGMVETG